YVADLRRNYPPETAEQLLQSNAKKPSPPRPDAAEERELKVYRAREAVEEPAVEALPAEPAPQSPTTYPTRPPAKRPEPAPAPSSPRLPRPVAWTRPPTATVSRATLAPAAEEEEEGATGLGFWVSSLLFLILLLAGLGLAAYAFARPFIPVG